MTVGLIPPILLRQIDMFPPVLDFQYNLLVAYGRNGYGNSKNVDLASVSGD